MGRVILETRLRFGQFGDGSSSSSTSASSGAPAESAPLPDLDLSAPRARADDGGDRLSPIERHHPAAPRERAPSHHRGLSGPTTPRSRPSAPTPPHAAPTPPARPVSPAKPSAPSHAAASALARPIGAHDFASGLAPRAPMPGTGDARQSGLPIITTRPGREPSVPAPPHAQRDGRRLNPLIPPGATLAPPTGTPKQWEADAARRRDEFARSFNRGIKTDRDGNIIGGGVQKKAVLLPPTRPEFARSGSSGRGINALMHRGDAVAPSTAAPVGRGFVRHVYDAARRAGIPETQARLAAAQAAHESAYGKRAPGHNYFGVKGVGTAGSQMLRTHEQGRRGMYKTTSKFARYAKPEDSLRHWWDKIQRQWPEAARAQTFEEAARGLRAGQRGGYATDRNYVAKIARIAAGIRPSIGVAGGSTPSGPTPPTSTASKP